MWSLYKQIDQVRRWQGRLLDVVGLGPQEAPHRVVYSESGFHLKPMPIIRLRERCC
jgi:hypothetical protein